MVSNSDFSIGEESEEEEEEEGEEDDNDKEEEEEDEDESEKEEEMKLKKMEEQKTQSNKVQYLAVGSQNGQGGKGLQEPQISKPPGLGGQRGCCVSCITTDQCGCALGKPGSWHTQS